MASTNRTGRVSAIDYEAGTYEVTYFDRGKSVTRQINAMSNGEYKMPCVGQVVSVAHNSNGTAAGTTTGTVWNKTNKPAEGYKGLYRKEYGTSRKGQAYSRYDENTGVYTQYVDKRTGRTCNGEIFDEAKGPVSVIAGGQLQLKSSGASASIQAKTGMGIVAGTTVAIEAGTFMSLEATSAMSISAGGDFKFNIGGDSEEKRKGTTKQEFANIYLNELDQYCKHKLKIHYYIRYMDDVIILGPDKETLHRWKAAVETFLREELALDLNSKTSIRPVRQGVEFVGVRIWPTHMKLRKSTVRRIKREVRKISALYAAGDMKQQDFYRRIASIRGLLKHTESASLRWRLNEIYRAELEKAKQKQLREEAQHEPFADHSGAGNGDGNAGTGYQDHGNPACRAG